MSFVTKAMLGSSALAAMLAHQPLRAQQAVQEPASADADADIVVTGQRAADRNAIKAKRAAPQIVDAISSDDIGSMADFSVGDALKRIAGVNTFNYQGEPRFATIRGFNSHYITTTLDGIEIASPDNQNQNNGGGRQFYLESLPSNIASRIEVIKTTTPDLAGHSIGGAINFAIPSAFDFRSPQLRLIARGGIQALDRDLGGNRPTYEGEAFLTRRFGGGDQFGIMVSASHWRRDQWIPNAERGSASYWYNPDGRNSGTAYVGIGPVGSERRWMVYDNHRERTSVLAKLDWRPDNGIVASLLGYYFTQHETAIRHDTIVSGGAGATVSNQTAMSGRIAPRPTAAADVQQSVRRFGLYFDRKIRGVQANVETPLADGLKFDARGAYSHATFDNPQISDNFVQGGLSFDYQNTDDGVLYTPVDTTRYNNPALYVGGTGTGNAQHMEERFTTDADHYEAKLRLSYRMDAGDEGAGAAIGTAFIRNQRDEAYRQDAWNGMRYTLADVLSTKRICSLLCNNGGLFLIDEAKLQTTLDRFLPTVTPVPTNAPNFGRTFGVVEDVLSGWAMTRYMAPNWSIVGGIRLERTDFSTNGFQARTRRVNGIANVSYVPVTAQSRYDHWLPSLTAAYDLDPRMRLRAAYSRTIGRPKYTDMGLLGGALNINDINNPVLTTGNPGLRPRRSDNFDLSYEWYLDDAQGLLSLALFRKAVKNEIYLLGQVGMIDVGGGVMTRGTITSPVNSDEMTYVNGIEVNLIKYFSFLPAPWSNFGINANGMYAKAHFPVRLQDGTRKVLNALPNQAQRVGNLSFFYEGQRFRGRVAWNHTGWLPEDRFLGTATSSAANFYRLRYARPSDIIDASFSYALGERLTLRLDANNLTGQGADDNNGRDRELPVARFTMATTVMAGVAVQF